MENQIEPYEKVTYPDVQYWQKKSLSPQSKLFLRAEIELFEIFNEQEPLNQVIMCDILQNAVREIKRATGLNNIE